MNAVFDEDGFLTPADIAALHAPASPGEPLLRVCGVTLQYKTPEYLVTATHRVSFDVSRGDRLVLLGPSGCGKSTLLKAVGGHIRPAEGEMLLNGKAVTRPGIDRGMVFQEFDQLLPWKTALDNIVFAIRNTRAATKAEAAAEARALLKLGSGVIIFSPHPGRVAAEFAIGLTARGDLGNPALIRLRERISRILFRDSPEYSI